MKENRERDGKNRDNTDRRYEKEDKDKIRGSKRGDALEKRERGENNDRGEHKKRKHSKSRSKSPDGRLHRDKHKDDRDRKISSQKDTDRNDILGNSGRNLGLSINTRPIVNIFTSNNRALSSNKLKVTPSGNNLEEGEEVEVDNKKTITVPEDEDNNDTDFADLEGFLGSNKEEEEAEADRLAAERRQRLQLITSKYQHKDKQDPSLTAPPKTSPPVTSHVSVQASQPHKEFPQRESGTVGTETSHSEKSMTTVATTSRAATLPLPSTISLENLSIMEVEAAGNPYDNFILSIAKQQQQQEELLKEQWTPSKLIELPRFEEAADDERKQLEAEKSALEAEEQTKNGGKNFLFDMFSASPSDFEKFTAGAVGGAEGGLKAEKGPPGVPINPGLGRRATREALLEGECPHLQSNWDDGEGYYKARVSELIGDRFQTLGESINTTIWISFVMLLVLVARGGGQGRVRHCAALR